LTEPWVDPAPPTAGRVDHHGLGTRPGKHSIRSQSRLPDHNNILVLCTIIVALVASAVMAMVLAGSASAVAAPGPVADGAGL
jgi:hypothetical protein